MVRRMYQPGALSRPVWVILILLILAIVIGVAGIIGCYLMQTIASVLPPSSGINEIIQKFVVGVITVMGICFTVIVILLRTYARSGIRF